MSDRLDEVIGEDLIAVYEGQDFTPGAVIWLREKSRTLCELLGEGIDWLRWMALNTPNQDALATLARDLDFDVCMRVACNSMAPAGVHSAEFGKAEPRFRHRSTGASLQEPHRAAIFLCRARHEVDTATLAAAFPCSRLSASLLAD